MVVITRLGYSHWARRAGTTEGVEEIGTGATGAGPRPFQVLALDGGGFRGMFSAAALAYLEHDLGVRLADYFDLIVGTSTGGIIALGLGAGRSPRELVEFYVKWGAHILDHPRRRALLRVARPKFSADHLREALEDVFGTQLLGACEKRLCVPSYDLVSDDVYLFRTPHHEELRRDWRTPMVDVAMATTAAPTYFPAHRLDGLRLIDGGVWANSPVAVGINEAINRFGRRREEIRVLSVGTTTAVRNRPRWLNHGGLAAWAAQGADVLLRAQVINAVNTMELTLPAGNWMRLDPKVQERLRRLDRVSPDDFIALAAVETRKRSNEVRMKFLGHTPEPYQVPQQLQGVAQ